MTEYIPAMLSFILCAIGAFLLWKVYQRPEWNGKSIFWAGCAAAFVSLVVVLFDLGTPLTHSIPHSESDSGETLYVPVGESRLLGGYWHFWWLGLLWGVVFAAVGAWKWVNAPAKPPTDKEAPEELEKFNIRENLQKDLDERIHAVRAGYGNPKAKGKEDALVSPDEGGPKPPSGEELSDDNYEAQIKAAYGKVSKGFVASAIGTLKEGLNEALAKLDKLAVNVNGFDWKADATLKYKNLKKELEPKLTPEDMKERESNFTKTRAKRNEFVRGLKLATDQTPDWSDKKKVGHLALFGWITAYGAIEFILNWFLLEPQIGARGAIVAAGIAFLSVLLLSYLLAYPWQYLKWNKDRRTALIPGLWYMIAIPITVLVVGLMIGYRDVDDFTAGSLWEGVKAGWKIDDIFDILLLGVNIMSGAFLTVKLIHWLEKYDGYEDLDSEFKNAKEARDGMYKQDQETVEKALSTVDDEASGQLKDAEKQVRMVEAITTLGGAGGKNEIKKLNETIQPKYVTDVWSYREENESVRGSVGPQGSPAYFKNAPESVLANGGDFNDLLNLFSDDAGKGGLGARINQANAKLEAIRKEVQRWTNKEREEIQAKLNAAFNQSVDDAVRGNSAKK